MKKGRIEIDRALCKGCYLCVRACPLHLLEKDTETTPSGTYPVKTTADAAADGAAVEKCIACGNCYTVCPDCAITVYEIESPKGAI